MAVKSVLAEASYQAISDSLTLLSAQGPQASQRRKSCSKRQNVTVSVRHGGCYDVP